MPAVLAPAASAASSRSDLARIIEVWDERRIAQAVWAFVAIGVGLRLVRYLLNFPLWGDECMVATNFLDRGFADMLQPLLHHQVCPPVFLWIELAITRALGFSEYTLRLFPTMCSVASVFLFRHVARQVLSGWAQLIAVATFCVAYYPIRHGAEVKQYAGDVVVSLALLSLILAWRRETSRSRWMWTLAAFVPLAVWSSLPAVFVAGGCSLATLPAVFRQRSANTWLAYAAFNVALLAAFLALYFTCAKAVHDEALSNGVHWHYREAFPPQDDPLGAVRWFFRIHVSHAFAYPLGGARGASSLTTLAFVIGLVWLWRSGKRETVMLFLGPFVLALAAGVLRKYPYGSNTRVMLYLSPIICLAAGAGVAAAIDWLKNAGARRVAERFVLAALLVVGATDLVQDLVTPYKTPMDARIRDFERWLWTDKANGAQLVCAWRDLGHEFWDGYWRMASCQYLCNQQAYSVRHAEGPAPPDWDKITKDHPLRCVLMTVENLPREEEEIAAWLAEMRRHFDLVGYERHQVNPGTGDIYGRTYEIYEFAPRTGASDGDVANRLANPATQNR